MNILPFCVAVISALIMTLDIMKVTFPRAKMQLNVIKEQLGRVKP